MIVSSGPRSTGRCSYRVLILAALGGPATPTLALAAPLAGVDAAVGALVRTLLLVGLVVLIGAARRRLVRHPARPAARSSASPRTAERHRGRRPDPARRRARTTAPRSGGSGTRSTRMLDQIEASFGEQQAALRRQGRQRGAAAPVRRRRLARAAHAADRRPRLRRPVPRRRPRAIPPSSTPAMARIGTESRRMGALVDDLLLLARLDQGRPLRQDPVDLSRIVARCRRRRARRSSPAARSWRAIDPGVVVTGDEDRLRQVVGNLLANVRMHTPPESPVEVATRAARRRRRSCASSTTARASTPSDGSSTSSTASTAPTPGARATAAAPGSASRSPPPSPRRTAGGSGTRPRRAAGRPSSCGSRSQQVHSRSTVRLQRT